MKAEEKAKELVEKFWNQFNYLVEYGDTRSEAKQCALICVDEIIEAINGLQYERKTDYWENVRKEIEKL